MIDHINLPVSDLELSLRFYERVLGVFGYRVLAQDRMAFGFGRDSWRFGIVQTPPPIPVLHIAFEAPSREIVEQFFEAAIAAGGRANGPPGLRPHYDANYFAAFVLDPDGHNVEAVCRKAGVPSTRRGDPILVGSNRAEVGSCGPAGGAGFAGRRWRGVSCVPDPPQ